MFITQVSICKNENEELKKLQASIQSGRVGNEEDLDAVQRARVVVKDIMASALPALHEARDERGQAMKDANKQTPENLVSVRGTTGLKNVAVKRASPPSKEPRTCANKRALATHMRR